VSIRMNSVVVFSYLLCCYLSSYSLAQKYPVTFGNSISQGWLSPGQEYVLFTYEGTGVITYFWCTEANDPTNTGETTFKIYIDKNPNPLEFTLDMLAGTGFDDNTAPWGTSHFGKAASTGGVYSTLRIPFSSWIKITGELPSSQTQGRSFWWVVRGVKNMPITVGGYPLPINTTLHLYKNQNVEVKPLQYLELVNTPNNGAVWMVVLAVTSGNLNYLEGCVRMYVGNATTPILISSGTEDYFQSAFYFDAGSFRLPEAGLTHRNDTAGQLSAYKVHNMDSFFFSSGGFQLTWRNGDAWDPKTGLKCVEEGKINGDPQNSTVTTYVWVYEW